MNLDSSDIIDQTSAPRKRQEPRIGALSLLLASVLLLIIGRGGYLQIVKGSEYRSRAEHNRVESIVLPAPRGVLYDKNKVQLVENISSTDVVFDPSYLPAPDSEAHVIDRIIELMPDIAPEAIQAALMRSRATQQETLLAKAIDHDTVLRIENAQGDIPGVKLASSLVRKYPFGEMFAHVLGYTSSVTAEELASDDTLIATDTTGKQGIEREYDKALRGQHGITYREVTASGKQKTDLGEKPPIAGQDITLTIDSSLQKFIYGLFSEKDAKKETEHPVRGAAIVMRAQDGAVISMVSYPSFDPNSFSQPSLRMHTTDIFSNPLNPLFNRAIDGTYPSGSTIKPFLAAGALQEGIITPNTTIYSTGGISVGPWRFADWKSGGHGITDVRKALAESVNTFFYMVSGGIESYPGLGVEKSISYLRAFQWGDRTGIDLPSEAPGFLPTPEWKLKATGQPWYIGDTYHLGIGQGDVLATPLQVAASTAAIANGGTWHQPHVTGTSAKEHNVGIAISNIRVVQEGMRQAITEGSARSLSSLPFPIAGKTGTAQIGGTEDTHAWFTSFGPYEQPSYVVTILLERGGAGDVDAVPLAKEIWQWLGENPD